MKKKFLWAFLGLILFVFIILAFIPSILSTDIGTKMMVDWINHKIPGKIAVKNVHLSWLGKQRVEELSLNLDDKKIASVSLFETRSSLLYLLLGGRKLKDTSFQSPYLFLEQREKGKETNLEKALGEKRDDKPKRRNKKKNTYPFFKNKLTVQDGTLIFSYEKIQPITISHINIDKQVNPDHFYLTAQTLQGTVDGTIALEAFLGTEASIKGDIKNFPVAIFDQLSETSLFSEAIGSTLNASINIKKEVESVSLDTKIESANLSALLKGETVNHELHLNPESNLTFNLTPSFFNQIIAPSQRGEWALASKSELKIKIEKGIFPLHLKTLSFQDIVFRAAAELDRAELSHKSLGSYSLNHFDVSIIAAHNLELHYKGEIRGKEATDLEGSISITPDKQILFNASYKGFPVSLIEIFSPQLANNLKTLFGRSFDLQASGTFVEEKLDSNFTVISPLLSLNGRLEGEFPEFFFNVEGKALVTGNKSQLIGPSLDLSLQGTLDASQGQPSILFINGKITNPQLDIDLRGKLGQKGEAFSYEQVHVVATGSIKQFLAMEAYQIKEGTFVVNVDGSKNLIYGKAQGSFQDELSEIHFEMKDMIQEGKFDLENTKTAFQFNLVQFPVALLNPLLPEEFRPTALIGEYATVTGKGKYYPGKKTQASLELNAKASGFVASFSLSIDEENKVTLNKPAHVHWEMTPERYQILISAAGLDPNYHPKYLLIRTTPIDLKISAVTCPSLEPQNLKGFLCKSGLEGDINIGGLIFKHVETNETFLVQDITGSIKGENLCEALNLSLSGNLAAPNIPHTENSSFTLNGQVLNICSSEGKFTRDKLAFKGELSLDLLPVKQLTEVAPMDDVTRKKIQAILGELVNARIYGEISHWNGPLTIDIKSSNFKAILPLQLTPQAIYLRDMVAAEITLTEQVNETLVKDINPIIITGAYSDHPIKVYIDPQGFVLPIHPYHLQGLRIEKAVIDIGRIRVQNGGPIQALMDFLKAKEISDDRVMEAWFTPIFMSLQNGVASYKRFDALLAKTVHIALWGDINLLNEKVRMTLGIAPTTLKQRFNVLGLNKKDMFQVKMRGTTDKLDLDWSSAYTRMGILITRTAGGPYGYILGGIVEQIMNLLGEEPSPSPTTSPFPWAEESVESGEPKQDIPQEAPPKKSSSKGIKKFIEFLIP